MAMKKVMLKITGTSVGTEHGEKNDPDVIEFITEGKIGILGETTLIVYEDPEETGFKNSQTAITISNKKVKVRRKMGFGDDQSEMFFEAGKRFTGRYSTPYGPISMELLTSKIEGIEDPMDIRNVRVYYDLSLKGLYESRNSLELKVLGDNSEVPNV